MLGERDVVEHLARDRALPVGALAAEDVERDAVLVTGRERGAALPDAGAGLVGRPERLAELGRVERVVAALVGAVEAVGQGRVPEEVAAAEVEAAVEARGDVERVDVLLEAARAGLDRAARDQVVGGPVERDPERVVRVGRVDDDVVEAVAVAGLGADEQRLGRGLVDRAPVGERGLADEAGAARQLVGDRAEHAHAARRREQVVVRREVEAIGRGEVVVVARKRRSPHAVVEREIVVGVVVRVVEDDAALRRRRRAARLAVIQAGDRRVGQLARIRAHRPLIEEREAEDRRHLVGGVAPRHLVLLRQAIALAVAAAVGAGEDAAVLLARDDVDHAADRVGAVDRRRAILEHLDVIDHAERDRVEVGGRRHARRRRAVDPAHAVDEHEHALGAEVAQVGLDRAGADAAAVGRVAEVAARVELAVDRAAGHRQLLQDVADRHQAGAIEILAGQAQHRRGLAERIADARAGDHDDLGVADEILVGDGRGRGVGRGGVGRGLDRRRGRGLGGRRRRLGGRLGLGRGRGRRGRCRRRGRRGRWGWRGRCRRTGGRCGCRWGRRGLRARGARRHRHHRQPRQRPRDPRTTFTPRPLIRHPRSSVRSLLHTRRGHRYRARSRFRWLSLAEVVDARRAVISRSAPRGRAHVARVG